jgi:hypothetical protein
LIFATWRKIDLYPTSRVKFCETVHNSSSGQTEAPLHFGIGALGTSLFPRLLFLPLRNRLCLGRRRGCLIFRRGGSSQFRHRHAPHRPRAWCP